MGKLAAPAIQFHLDSLKALKAGSEFLETTIRMEKHEFDPLARHNTDTGEDSMKHYARTSRRERLVFARQTEKISVGDGSS